MVFASSWRIGEMSLSLQYSLRYSSSRYKQKSFTFGSLVAKWWHQAHRQTSQLDNKVLGKGGLVACRKCLWIPFRHISQTRESMAAKFLASSSSFFPRSTLKHLNMFGTWVHVTNVMTRSIDCWMCVNGKWLHSSSSHIAIMASQTYWKSCSSSGWWSM